MIRLGLLLALLAGPAIADTRLATYNTGLGRDGPGLLLKDILDQDADILALAEVIGTVSPDILLLTGFDNDFQNRAINAFNGLEGLGYPFIYAPLGNAGAQSGLDIDGNGYQRDWNDAWGFGRFEGAEGMALLSRFPVVSSRRFDTLKWQDFGPVPRNPNGTAFYGDDLWPQLRLASHSLWDVELALPSGPLRIIAAHPTPPVFDGEEDANGHRNAAEISFLARYLSGEPFRDDSGLSAPLSTPFFAVLADLNADPERGDSRPDALRGLLASPHLQDPRPLATTTGSAATTAWDSPANMRVDYVLPSAALTVLGSGVFWPADSTLLEAAETSHRLVWVDIATP